MISPKQLILSLITLPTYRSKPVRPLFIFGTHIKIFFMKTKSLTDKEENKLLNKVISFVFFAHKNYFL